MSALSGIRDRGGQVFAAFGRPLRRIARGSRLPSISPRVVGLLLAGLVLGLALWVQLTAGDNVAERIGTVPTVRVMVAEGERPGMAAIGQEGAKAVPEQPAASNDQTAAMNAEAAMASGMVSESGASSAMGGGMAVGPANPMRDLVDRVTTGRVRDNGGQADSPSSPSAPSMPTMGPVEMATAPAAGLVEDTPDGPLPRISFDGEKPWQVYARPFPEGDPRARIAIVIAELGMAGRVTSEVVERLPGEVTLAFQSHAERLETWVETARRDGHEVLLQVPMQPRDYGISDPGPRALLVVFDNVRNLQRLHTHLRSVSGYVGVTPFLGSAFLRDRRALLPVLEELRTRGVLFLDTGAGGRNPGPSRWASEIGTAWVRSNLIIDQDLARSVIDRQLQRLVEIARTEGAAVGIGRPNAVTIERIEQWIRALPGRDVTLAPVSAVVGRQGLPAEEG